MSGNPTTVRIPDTFSSIMSAEAPLNPHHFKVKAAADAWIAGKRRSTQEYGADRRTAGTGAAGPGRRANAVQDGARRYLDSLTRQVEASARSGSSCRPQTEHEDVEMRRRTVGGYPCINKPGCVPTIVFANQRAASADGTLS
ncbi:uncharacterized protein MAM_02555 [Metarhizium album ARSEF 1941]|uniref:Uncharacterized protein n=1 Tax=Metarhizium album (strain ARSEF 1941) TaxID=1081103 RepID=A0A0B2X1V7_METAS|nr:uncharacterized protein MAM_02555 [Metarhizium album ARSEF 1941]KHN99702.1 hypothetical protein MAM_02555 [Metarhizium album ARSEF 1941]